MSRWGSPSRRRCESNVPGHGARGLLLGAASLEPFDAARSAACCLQYTISASSYKTRTTSYTSQDLLLNTPGLQDTAELKLKLNEAV